MIVCKVTACSTRRPPDVRGVRTLIASCPGTPSSAPAGVERVQSRRASRKRRVCELPGESGSKTFRAQYPREATTGSRKEMTLAASVRWDPLPRHMLSRAYVNAASEKRGGVRSAGKLGLREVKGLT